MVRIVENLLEQMRVGRLTEKGEDTIKIDVSVTGCEYVEWKEVTQFHMFKIQKIHNDYGTPICRLLSE